MQLLHVLIVQNSAITPYLKLSDSKIGCNDLGGKPLRYPGGGVCARPTCLLQGVG